MSEVVVIARRGKKSHALIFDSQRDVPRWVRAMERVGWTCAVHHAERVAAGELPDDLLTEQMVLL